MFVNLLYNILQLLVKVMLHSPSSVLTQLNPTQWSIFGTRFSLFYPFLYLYPPPSCAQNLSHLFLSTSLAYLLPFSRNCIYYLSFHLCQFPIFIPFFPCTCSSPTFTPFCLSSLIKIFFYYLIGKTCLPFYLQRQRLLFSFFFVFIMQGPTF